LFDSRSFWQFEMIFQLLAIDLAHLRVRFDKAFFFAGAYGVFVRSRFRISAVSLPKATLTPVRSQGEIVCAARELPTGENARLTDSPCLPFVS